MAKYPTSEAKSLACDTANEDALERHAAAVRQLSNGDDLRKTNTNGWEHFSDS